MRIGTGRHRRNRTLSIAAAVALSSGAGGVYLGLAPDGASAAGATVTVSSTAELESAVKNAVAGRVIQVRAGTYYPTATLKSTANGTSSARITLRAYGGEKVRIDGSRLPAGSWLAGIYGDYWTVQDLTFQNSPAQGFVVTSSVGGIFRNLVTASNGDSGFTLRGDGTSGNLVQNLDSHLNYDPAAHGQNADGLAIKFGSGTGNRITGARLYDNADDGIDLWQFSTAVTIEHTWAFGNGQQPLEGLRVRGQRQRLQAGRRGCLGRACRQRQRGLGQQPARVHGELQHRCDPAQPQHRLRQRQGRLLLHHRQGPSREEPRGEQQGGPVQARSVHRLGGQQLGQGHLDTGPEVEGRDDGVRFPDSRTARCRRPRSWRWTRQRSGRP